MINGPLMMPLWCVRGLRLKSSYMGTWSFQKNATNKQDSDPNRCNRIAYWIIGLSNRSISWSNLFRVQQYYQHKSIQYHSELIWFYQQQSASIYSYILIHIDNSRPDILQKKRLSHHLPVLVSCRLCLWVRPEIYYVALTNNSWLVRRDSLFGKYWELFSPRDLWFSWSGCYRLWCDNSLLCANNYK